MRADPNSPALPRFWDPQGDQDSGNAANDGPTESGHRDPSHLPSAHVVTAATSGHSKTAKKRGSHVQTACSTLLLQQVQVLRRTVPAIVGMLLDHPRPPPKQAELCKVLKKLVRTKQPKEKGELADIAATLAPSADLGEEATAQFIDVMQTWALLLRPTIEGHSLAISTLTVKRGVTLRSDTLLYGIDTGSMDVVAAEGIAHDLDRHWLQMFELALAAAPKGFNGWSVEDLRGAIHAIRAHFAVGNRINERRSRFSSDDNVQLRQDYVSVGLPLWAQLHEALTKLNRYREEASPEWTRVRQGALLVHLMGRITSDPERRQSLAQWVTQHTGIPPQAAALQGAIVGELGDSSLNTMTLVVAPDFDPNTAWRDEKAELLRFANLKEPLPIARLPELAQIEAIQARMCEEFPWAHEAVEALVGDLWTRRALGCLAMGMHATLLVGTPGCGKTRLARRMAELLSVPSVTVGLGGRGDSKLLVGTARGWGGARPGLVPQLLSERSSASALVVFDEVDKATSNTSGDAGPQAALLQLLEPENASRWHDSFLLTTVDLSRVMFMATSNSVTNLSKPLYSRLRPIVVPEPRKEHMQGIANFVMMDLAKEWGLPRAALPDLPRLNFDGVSTPRQVKAMVELWVKDFAKGVRQGQGVH